MRRGQKLPEVENILSAWVSSELGIGDKSKSIEPFVLLYDHMNLLHTCSTEYIKMLLRLNNLGNGPRIDSDLQLNSAAEKI